MIELANIANITRSATEPTPESGAGSGQGAGPDPVQEMGFGQILSDQEGVPALLEQLQQLMPEDELEQMDILLQGGTELPEAADIVTEPRVPVETAILIPQAETPVIGTPQTGTPVIGTSRTGTPVIGTPRIGTPVIGTSRTGTPVIGTPRIGTSATGISQGGDIPIISFGTGRHFEVAAPDESGVSTFQGAITGNAKGVDPTLIPNLAAEKNGTATAALLPRIDSTLIPDREKPAPSDNRTEVFTTSLGRITGEGGISARPVTAPMASLSLPPGHDGWSQELGDRVLWMVGRSIQSASLRVTPPRMGPVEIQVAMQHDQAHVTFTTHHGVVKEALEAAIPRLREMFGENNLQLLNVDVEQRGEGDSRPMAENFTGQGEAGHSGRAPFDAVAEPGDEAPGSGVERYYRSNGLLDDFA